MQIAAMNPDENSAMITASMLISDDMLAFVSLPDDSRVAHE